MQSLSLWFCHRLTSASVAHIGPRFGNLASLVLWGCHRLDDDAVESLCVGLTYVLARPHRKPPTTLLLTRTLSLSIYLLYLSAAKQVVD